MLNSYATPELTNNRSVMPLDVWGCTRTTLNGSTCVYPAQRGVGKPLNPIRDGDRGLQLFPTNEEFPVSTGHKIALIKIPYQLFKTIKPNLVVTKTIKKKKTLWGISTSKPKWTTL
uniref:Uncharacterized protein n=1 Tax=Erpetoichthys calabaricus TaxID=27687 RepID=A0A8C4T566_ERPCA